MHACAGGTAASAAPQVLPRIGDYLDVRYVEALSKTLSPWKAGAEDRRLGLPQALIVQADGAGRRVALNYGWHDGRMLVVLGRNGVMHRELAWRRGPDMALRVVGTDRLCLAAAPEAERCYRYVGDAGRFVTRAVLVGNYVDRQGQPYAFSAGGQAHFPGFDFRYALVLDQHDTPYDVFQIGDGSRSMAFRRAGQMVTLYRVGAGGGTPDFGHPLAVLRTGPPRRILASALGR
jgi:hypothetical protein